ncbi:MAG: methyl-accepting chemotaxis protein [Desulfobacteraceae bacterium]|nr:MAG: methyl-accepting chemotaxis protein [Desulfobacteraceae bacterium]
MKKMFEKMRLKNRILLGYIVPILFSVISFAVIYLMLQASNKAEDRYNKTSINLHQVERLETVVQGFQAGARGYLIDEDENSRMRFEIYQKEFLEMIRSLPGMFETSEEQADVKNIIDIALKMHTTCSGYLSLLQEGKKDESLELFSSAVALDTYKTLDLLISEFKEKENSKMLDLKTTAESRVFVLKVSIVAGILFTIFFAIAIGLWISSRISRELVQVIASISTTSTEIASTIAEHERTASQQAVMVNQTSTTIDELGASAQQTAEQSNATVLASEDAASITDKGSRVIQQSIAAMDRLKEKVGGIAEQILRLSEQTNQIGNIAELLKDLAGQINMLALNASVEAARAGEHGKGFAVVASEVRKLAVESRKSADQAKIIISDIQKATNTTIMTTEEGTRTVEDVSDLTLKVGDFITDLAEAANVVNTNSQQVLINARQQSSAISQVVSAVNSINSGARETAAGISQTKSAMDNLSAAAQKLNAMV